MTALLALLAQYVAEDPKDPFNLYAYALELAKTDPAQGYQTFVLLKAKFPDYLPTYYTAASLAIELDSVEDAKELYKSGMELAKTQNNNKTYQELSRALTNLIADLD